MKSLRVQPQPQPQPPPPPTQPPPLPEEALLLLSGQREPDPQPPAEKKQKLNKEEEDDEEEDDDDDDDDGNFSCRTYSSNEVPPLTPNWDTSGDEFDSEEDYCPNWPEQKVRDHALWDKYYQQLEESEGFDIQNCPGSCPMLTIYPMRNYLSCPKNYDRLKGYCVRALEHYYNEKGTDHEVKDVLKVNGGGCQYFDYYITFSIKTPERDGKADDLFQAKVEMDMDGEFEILIVRPKPKNDLDT